MLIKLMFKGIPIKTGMRRTLFEEFLTTTHVRIRFQEDYATAKTSFHILGLLRSLYRPKGAEASKHTSKLAAAYRPNQWGSLGQM